MNETTTATTTRETTPTPRDERKRIWPAGAVFALAALAANLVLFGLARIADVSFVVQSSSDADPTEVTAGHVALTTLVGFVIGLGAATLAARRSPSGLRAVQILGAVIAVSSVAMPLTLDADTGAKVVLAAMHLVTGAAFVAALGRIRAT